jgi:hypothetical protein
MITLTDGGELVARQAQQPRWGTWRPNAGDGTVLRPPPGRPGPEVTTDRVFAPGQRIKSGWALASRRSDAHTGDHVVLLQTLAGRSTAPDPGSGQTADTGVKLSAEPSRVVTGIRSVTHSRGVRARRRRHAPGPMADRDTSPRGPERINRQDPIQKPRRRRVNESASPLSRGVTTPDLPEGI